ncbi:MAG: alpha/beta fold hydrolase [Acidobacteria bacterium]|nr:alpha/beta fold hydrolase [Acidobacteriota bacterium]
MQLNYLSYGSGEALIILHGLFGSLDNWHTLSKSFAEHYKVFSLDQRNHGRSPHSEEFNYSILVQDLLEFMEQQNIKVANILGHSMGGKVAMQFALSYPDRVAKLVIADIAPKSYPPTLIELFQTLSSIDLSRFSNRKEIDKDLAEGVKDFAVRQFILKNIYQNSEGKFSWKMNLPVIKKSYLEMSGSINLANTFSKPTLFIRGEKSSYIEDSDVSLIKSFFPFAQIVTMAKVGHWVHAENPKEFFQIVMEFLSKE